MLPARVQAAKERDRLQYGRKLFCKKCRTVLKDHEPYATSGAFLHKDNDCVNSGQSFDWEPEPRVRAMGTGKIYAWGGKHTSGIVQWLPKRDRRARKRGAKLASKSRPK